jgi:hypothetical protein
MNNELERPRKEGAVAKLKYHPELYLKWLRKSMNNFRLVGISAEIWIQHLTNMS